jgi:hypothetical protein
MPAWRQSSGDRSTGCIAGQIAGYIFSNIASNDSTILPRPSKSSENLAPGKTLFINSPDYEYRSDHRDSSNAAVIAVHSSSSVRPDGNLPRTAIPVTRVRLITLTTVKIGVDPRSGRRLDILNYPMRLVPVTTLFVPHRRKVWCQLLRELPTCDRQIELIKVHQRDFRMETTVCEFGNSNLLRQLGFGQ